MSKAWKRRRKRAEAEQTNETRARNHKKPSALEMAHCIFPSESDSFVNVPPNVRSHPRAALRLKTHRASRASGRAALLNGSKYRPSNGLRKFDWREESSRIEIVFARFVDDPN